MGLISTVRKLFSGERKAVEFDAAFRAALLGDNGTPTNSGESVSLNSALRNMPFYRGVVLLGEGVAQLPVEIYRRSGRGSEPAVDHPLYDLLMHRPNGLQDSFQFFRTMVMHAAGTGNAYAYKNMVRGQVRELIPVRPECVSVDLDILMNRTYSIVLEGGDYVKTGQEDVFHMTGPSWAFHRGMDPINVGREAIGLANATEKTHAKLHANGTRPSGILHTDQKLSAADVDRLREQWRQQNGGMANTGGTPVLTGGLNWTQTAQKGVDAEHLDTRKLQIEEIARLLGIFPIMLGHAGNQSPTFASAEAFFAAHVRYSLQPWIKATSKAIEVQLLTKEERAAGYHVRIDTSELLRGSLKDRAEYYRSALGDNNRPGWMTPNEVREDDGWNPDDDARMDEVWKPVTTMSPSAEGGAPGVEPAPPAPTE
jgi:HK97 family phage portal protein